jgi:hypothetical protein
MYLLPQCIGRLHPNLNPKRHRNVQIAQESQTRGRDSGKKGDGKRLLMRAGTRINGPTNGLSLCSIWLQQAASRCAVLGPCAGPIGTSRYFENEQRIRRDTRSGGASM